MSRVRPWDMPPPGLDLDGFLETHESVQARMLARLGTYCPEGVARPPLEGLVGKADDPAVMLLDAWSTVVDVLYFYQRRLLAEGFVSTAVHARSVHEMASAVAVDVSPAESASVVLCFTVSDKQPGPVQVPLGTGVQSVPGSGGGFRRAPSRTDVAAPLTLPLTPAPTDPGSMPQIFETSAALTARAEWNEVPLAGSPDADGGAVTGEAVGVLVQGGSFGVKPGDALIFVAPGAGGGPGFAALRTVQRIGRARARGCTLFLWSPAAPLDPGASAIAGLQLFTCRAQEALYGNDAPEWSDLPLAQRAQYRAMVGGLQGLDETTGSFRNVEQPAPAGHPAEGRVPLGRVLCLAAGPGGALLAGVAGVGLLRRTGDADPWAPVTGIASKSDVLCLAGAADGRLYAGTPRGVYRSADQGQTWEPIVGGGRSPESTPAPQYAFYRLPATPVRGIAVLAGDGGDVVIAGTDDGVFGWDPVNRIWPAMNQGLPPLARAGSAAPATAASGPGASIAIRALATDAKGTAVYAGTGQGLFVRTAASLDKPWIACDGASGFDVAALGIDARGVVYAGLAARGGLAVRGADGTWTRAGGQLADATVRAVVVADDTPDPAVVVGTDRGVFRSTDGGQTFTLLGGGTLSNPDVTALALSPGGAVLAATPFVGVADAQGKDDDWPDWALEDGRIDLARTTARVAPGDRVALVQDAGDASAPLDGGAAGSATAQAPAEPLSLVLEVRGVATSTRDGFGRRRPITTLLVGDADLSAFDRRRARACFAGTGIPLFDQQVRDLTAVASTDLTLDDHLASDVDFAELTRGKTVVTPADPQQLDLAGVVSDLSGRQVVVVGKPLRVRAAVKLKLVPDARVPPVKIVAGEVLDVLAMPGTTGGGGRWTLRTRLDVEGTVDAVLGDLTLLPAAADADDVAQVRRVTSSVATSLPRGLPLPGPLPVTRVTLDTALSGLLDPATVTVMANVVEATHGRTVLPDGEVLGTSDGSANLRFTLKNKPLTWIRTGGEIAPALSVWVQKHLWARVGSFAGQGPDSLVFTVKTTSDGASVVCFGDGVRGRRPPAESEIVADYRYGAGVAGNVGAGRITMIRQRPLGLKAVVNPLDAEGGEDPEPADDLRERAPLAVRALDRIVSARDCADVAATSPGIALACATQLTKDRRTVLFVTVATADEDAGHQLDTSSSAYRDLMTRLQPAHGVEVGSATVTYFDVEVALSLGAGASPDEAKAAVKSALLAGFGFDRRDLRQSVAASDIVASLAAIEGVLGVRVAGLATVSGRAADAGVLAARDAAWDATTKGIVPAEILLINAADDGVTIDVGGAT